MNAGEIIDYYGLLGVSQAATVSEIHKAYWHHASRSHPDRGGDHEEMVRLVEAWKILSNPEKRSRYDQLLKSRHDGWQSRQFNDDVQDARKGAEEHAAMSWAEFEEIYQKAFYTFNRDFYGEEIDGKAAGPYSPLMGTRGTGVRVDGASKSKPAGTVSNRAGGTVFAWFMKTTILFAAIAATLLFYRYYIGIGRYLPLEQQNGAGLLMLDTANGAVYSVEKRAGPSFFTWKETVSPLHRGKKPNKERAPRKRRWKRTSAIASGGRAKPPRERCRR